MLRLIGKQADVIDSGGTIPGGIGKAILTGSDNDTLPGSSGDKTRGVSLASRACLWG